MCKIIARDFGVIFPVLNGCRTVLIVDVNSEQTSFRKLRMGGDKEQLREHIKASVEIYFVCKLVSVSWTLATVLFVHKVQHFCLQARRDILSVSGCR
jgi:hypothetical protein